ncbi:unnamed protein product [Albugo candida]|uniref:Uncharacterized protein n=1 Tax=Albugo candida TaxID=65357 RepID=A0A024FT16_9STRA|nr:unnamed protein product [Albugo candida]|eukprot:CCI10116.1 unnamed protein product [Albugo candida]
MAVYESESERLADNADSDSEIRQQNDLLGRLPRCSHPTVAHSEMPGSTSFRESVDEQQLDINATITKRRAFVGARAIFSIQLLLSHVIYLLRFMPERRALSM